MGTKINTSSSNFAPTPTMDVRNKKGQYFVGTLTGHKSQPNGYKNEKTGAENHYEIYSFSVEDTDMDASIKNGKDYAPATIEEGAAVALFAPTRLHNALRQVTVGQRVKITYLGQGKATKFGGKPYDYEVEVI